MGHKKTINDHPVKGIVMMTLALLLIAAMNMFSKLATEFHEPFEVVFWRAIIALLIVFCIIGYKKDKTAFQTTRLKEQIFRGIAGTAGINLVFWAYSLMPMANVVAIMFTAGLMTTGLSAILLGEKVGIYRWSAVAIGFIGAIIAVSPSGENLWDLKGSVVAFSAAFIGGALVSTMLRSLGSTENALTTVFYTLSINLALTTPFVIAFGSLPSIDVIPYLVGCGIAGGSSLILKTEAYRYAEASLLSPVHYTAIIWATLLGWLVWNDFPTPNVLFGAWIIIIANIVIIWREKVKSKTKKDPGLLM